MRQVTINKAMNGFIVQVGCQTLVFSTSAHLVCELLRYLNNPQEVEKEYVAKYGMSTPHPPQSVADINSGEVVPTSYPRPEPLSTVRDLDWTGSENAQCNPTPRR